MNDKFFLIITRVGDYLKSRYKKDFETVIGWDSGDFLFSGIQKNSDWVHYKLGGTWFRKKIAHLKISRSSEVTPHFQDIHQINTKNCNFISKIKIGGAKIPETIENL